MKCLTSLTQNAFTPLSTCTLSDYGKLDMTAWASACTCKCVSYMWRKCKEAPVRMGVPGG